MVKDRLFYFFSFEEEYFMVNKTNVKKSPASSAKASPTYNRIKEESEITENTESVASISQPVQPVNPKGFWEWYMTSWKKTFSYAGRASRTEFFSFYLVNFFISFLLQIFSASMLPVNILLYVFAIATILPSLAVYVRRFHDRGKSGWYAFMPYLLYVGISVPVIIGAAIYNYTYAVTPTSQLIVMGLIGLVSLIFVLLSLVWFIFLFLKGDPIPNQYGNVPEAPTKAVKITLFVLGGILITIYAALILLIVTVTTSGFTSSPNFLNDSNFAQNSAVTTPYQSSSSKQIQEAAFQLAAASLQNPALNTTGFNIPLPEGMVFVAAENGTILFEVPNKEIAQQIQTNGFVCEETKCVFDARTYTQKNAH